MRGGRLSARHRPTAHARRRQLRWMSLGAELKATQDLQSRGGLQRLPAPAPGCTPPPPSSSECDCGPARLEGTGWVWKQINYTTA